MGSGRYRTSTKADLLLRFFTNPYLITSLGILCWSGNFVVGRWANIDVPPIALSFWRHLFAAVVIVPFVLPYLKKDMAEIGNSLWSIAAMGGLLAAGNTLVYYAVLHTTVTNAALINAGVPVATIAFSWLLLRDLINRWQAVGIVLAFSGIVLVVTRADTGILMSLRFGPGDLFMLLSVVCWAMYLVMLKRTPVSVSPLTLLFVMTVSGTAWLTPAYGVELAMGLRMDWSWITLACLGYVVLFSTLVAWACVNYGALKLGPNRASAFMCLHPVFGAILGAIFFDEVLRGYHWAGTALVLIGVVMVSRAYAARTE
ncbi:MAG: DMT family transporter [Alphaproteobacteria bacterium]